MKMSELGLRFVTDFKDIIEPDDLNKKKNVFVLLLNMFNYCINKAQRLYRDIYNSLEKIKNDIENILITIKYYRTVKKGDIVLSEDINIFSENIYKTYILLIEFLKLLSNKNTKFLEILYRAENLSNEFEKLLSDILKTGNILFAYNHNLHVKCLDELYKIILDIYELLEIYNIDRLSLFGKENFNNLNRVLNSEYSLISSNIYSDKRYGLASPNPLYLFQLSILNNYIINNKRLKELQIYFDLVNASAFDYNTIKNETLMTYTLISDDDEYLVITDFNLFTGLAKTDKTGILINPYKYKERHGFINNVFKNFYFKIEKNDSVIHPLFLTPINPEFLRKIIAGICDYYELDEYVFENKQIEEIESYRYFIPNFVSFVRFKDFFRLDLLCIEGEDNYNIKVEEGINCAENYAVNGYLILTIFNYIRYEPIPYATIFLSKIDLINLIVFDEYLDKLTLSLKLIEHSQHDFYNILRDYDIVQVSIFKFKFNDGSYITVPFIIINKQFENPIEVLDKFTNKKITQYLNKLLFNVIISGFNIKKHFKTIQYFINKVVELYKKVFREKFGIDSNIIVNDNYIILENLAVEQIYFNREGDGLMILIDDKGSLLVKELFINYDELTNNYNIVILPETYYVCRDIDLYEFYTKCLNYIVFRSKKPVEENKYEFIVFDTIRKEVVYRFISELSYYKTGIEEISYRDHNLLKYMYLSTSKYRFVKPAITLANSLLLYYDKELFIHDLVNNYTLNTLNIDNMINTFNNKLFIYDNKILDTNFKLIYQSMFTPLIPYWVNPYNIFYSLDTEFFANGSVVYWLDENIINHKECPELKIIEPRTFIGYPFVLDLHNNIYNRFDAIDWLCHPNILLVAKLFNAFYYLKDCYNIDLKIYKDYCKYDIKYESGRDYTLEELLNKLKKCINYITIKRFFGGKLFEYYNLVSGSKKLEFEFIDNIDKIENINLSFVYKIIDEKTRENYYTVSTGVVTSRKRVVDTNKVVLDSKIRINFLTRDTLFNLYKYNVYNRFIKDFPFFIMFGYDRELFNILEKIIDKVGRGLIYIVPLDDSDIYNIYSNLYGIIFDSDEPLYTTSHFTVNMPVVDIDSISLIYDWQTPSIYSSPPHYLGYFIHTPLIYTPPDFNLSFYNIYILNDIDYNSNTNLYFGMFWNYEYPADASIVITNYDKIDIINVNIPWIDGKYFENTYKLYKVKRFINKVIRNYTFYGLFDYNFDNNYFKGNVEGFDLFNYFIHNISFYVGLPAYTSLITMTDIPIILMYTNINYLLNINETYFIDSSRPLQFSILSGIFNDEIYLTTTNSVVIDCTTFYLYKDFNILSKLATEYIKNSILEFCKKELSFIYHLYREISNLFPKESILNGCFTSNAVGSLLNINNVKFKTSNYDISYLVKLNSVPIFEIINNIDLLLVEYGDLLYSSRFLEKLNKHIVLLLANYEIIKDIENYARLLQLHNIVYYDFTGCIYDNKYVKTNLPIFNPLFKVNNLEIAIAPFYIYNNYPYLFGIIPLPLTTANYKLNYNDFIDIFLIIDKEKFEKYKMYDIDFSINQFIVDFLNSKVLSEISKRYYKTGYITVKCAINAILDTNNIKDDKEYLVRYYKLYEKCKLIRFIDF